MGCLAGGWALATLQLAITVLSGWSLPRKHPVMLWVVFVCFVFFFMFLSLVQSFRDEVTHFVAASLLEWKRKYFPFWRKYERN